VTQNIVRPLAVGDPVPWFVGRSEANPAYRVDSLAGRTVLLLALGTPSHPALESVTRDLLAAVAALAEPAVVPLLIVNPGEEAAATALAEPSGTTVLFDDDLRIAAGLGTLGRPAIGERLQLPAIFVLGRDLSVAGVFPVGGPEFETKSVLELIGALRAPVDTTAPVLLVPRVFEPALCQEFIALYDRHGGTESGFMQTDPEGRTRYAFDARHKRRRDYLVEDEKMRAVIRDRLKRRVVPAIKKAFQFDVTRIERYLVACYSADEGGHFRAHRDNTTKATAHRRFAVSINLDTSRHGGGDLRFAEFGERTYRPESGGAVVFSCSLLHEATPVTSGVRYCVLPFLYDEAAAEIREKNREFLVGEPVAQQSVSA
jgi:predicted 2-oxoglutarate/Fe(II)-dependent dioxygenase YbiX